MATNTDNNWREIGEVVAEFISRKPDMLWELAHSLGDHVSRDFNVSCADSFYYVSVYRKIMLRVHFPNFCYFIQNIFDE